MEIWELIFYINRVSRAINRDFIFSAITYIIGATIVFVLLWWALRKAFKAIIAATKKGKSQI